MRGTWRFLRSTRSVPRSSTSLHRMSNGTSRFSCHRVRPFAVADADRPGVRIAVVLSHSSTLALSRIVQHAELVYADDLDKAFELLRRQKTNLLASAKQDLPQYAVRLPGSQVLDEAYASTYGAMAVPKGHPERLADISEVVQEAKTPRFLPRALGPARQRGG